LLKGIQHVDGDWEPRSPGEECEVPINRILHETDAAVLLRTTYGEDWVPKSQLIYASMEEGVAMMFEWIAIEKEWL
jgi:hypothetical protein